MKNKVKAEHRSGWRLIHLILNIRTELTETGSARKKSYYTFPSDVQKEECIMYNRHFCMYTTEVTRVDIWTIDKRGTKDIKSQLIVMSYTQRMEMTIFQCPG